MQRHKTTPRPAWQPTVEDLGFSWHTHSTGAPYWDESAYWTISLGEADVLQSAGREAYEMVLDTIEHVIRTGKLSLYGYDADTQRLVEKSWEESDNTPTLYGRFDFAFDGDQPKLLEYNGDNPGALFETAMVQRQWAQELFPDRQQFNVLHEQMQEAFRWVGQTDQNMAALHITGLPNDPESEGTAAYLANCAEQAGLSVVLLGLPEIGFWQENGVFVDGQDNPIHTLLKLRPTEWMLEGGDLAEPFKQALLGDKLRTLEPPWKMLASNKRLLVDMWERYAYHPLLLNTSMSPVVAANGSVRKPVAGYEGQNVLITDVSGNEVERSKGAYEGQPVIYQERANLANQDGQNAVCGVWVSQGDGVALAIRESANLITDANATFVPHIIS